MAAHRFLLVSALLASGPSQAAPAAAPAAAALQDRSDISSKRDYSDNRQRDLPIACKAGDLERHPGKTLAQVFGADWPSQPEPATPTAHVEARATKLGRRAWPRGLEGKRALVVLAVLVDADGKPLRAEPLCATATGFDMSARRTAMGGSYEPAQVNGAAVVSPAIVIINFSGSVKRRGKRPGFDD